MTGVNREHCDTRAALRRLQGHCDRRDRAVPQPKLTTGICDDLYSYGLYVHGLYRYGLYVHGLLVMAYVFLATIMPTIPPTT